MNEEQEQPKTSLCKIKEGLAYLLIVIGFYLIGWKWIAAGMAIIAALDLLWTGGGETKIKITIKKGEKSDEVVSE